MTFTPIQLFEEQLYYNDDPEEPLYHTIKYSIELLVGRMQSSSYT